MQPAGSSTPRPERSAPFQTTHLPLAAYLASHGHVPRTVAVDRRTVRFEFEASDKLDALVEQFTNGYPTVHPTSYDTWARSLRSQVQAVLEAERGRSA
jgi:ABC-type transport system substrate-binding protein